MTQAANEGTVAQQWTDDDIITRYQNAFGKSPDVYHMAFVRCVRDDMQAAQLAAMQADDLAKWQGFEDTIAELRRQLQDARRAIAEIESGPEWTPKPDWSQAHEWVMWWAVNPDGSIMWYEEEPLRYETVTYCGWGAKVIYGLEQGMKLGAGDIDIPLGIDWRTLKQYRLTGGTR